MTGSEDGSSSQSEIDFEDEEEGEGEESFETTSTSPVASSAPVLASTFTVTSAESDFDDLPMTEEVAAAPAPTFVAPVQSIVAPVQVVAMQAPEPEVAAPMANVAPLSTPSVSEVYALPAEPAPVQPVVSMTIEPLPAASAVAVREEVPLMPVAPESNVAWLPELELVAQIAEPGEVVEDEMKHDESVADANPSIRNTPAV